MGYGRCPVSLRVDLKHLRDGFTRRPFAHRVVRIVQVRFKLLVA